MVVESDFKNGYQILRVKDDLDVDSDLTGLKEIVEGHLAKAVTNIAVSFTPGSFLYSKNIAIMVQCLEVIQEHGGKFALIKPNDDILSAVSLIGFDNLLEIYRSEDDIGKS